MPPASEMTPAEIPTMGKNIVSQVEKKLVPHKPKIFCTMSQIFCHNEVLYLFPRMTLFPISTQYSLIRCISKCRPNKK